MTRLTGELVVCADSPHVYQVITGFLMLQREGIVDVVPRYDRTYRPHLPSSHIAELRLREGVTVAYDMIDGYNFVGPAALDDYLGHVNVYFKRSFDSACHAGLSHASRIVPFGLNYPVAIRHGFFARLNASGLRDWPERAARLLLGPRAIDVRRFEDVPRGAGDPRVLFQTRTWDPDEIANLSEAERCERLEMNEMRAACLRALRRELGPRFRGGFMPSPHANAAFPDCVVDPPSAATKRHFMQTLKQSDICIATAGLHRSNGWSIGEYVAASKAVVAQHLRYSVPGFREGRHYLGFATPGECVERVSELVDDPARLHQMKVDNYSYYHRHLRPDRLVLNSLLVAMGN